MKYRLLVVYCRVEDGTLRSWCGRLLGDHHQEIIIIVFVIAVFLLVARDIR